jgi:hypothetical protein
MADSGALNLKTKLDMLERFNVPIATGEDVVEGEWFGLNAQGEASKTAATDIQLAFLAFAGTDRPDSRNTQSDPITGVGTPVEISTGGVTGIRGDYRADVDATGFVVASGPFTADEPLRVNGGQLDSLTASEPVVAFVEQPVSPDNRLAFQTT